jgi:hypothetical protein
MNSTSCTARVGRRSRPWVMAILRGGTFALMLLAAVAADAQAGGLLERLLTGTASQRPDAPPPQGEGSLSTVRLTVEGMVCYG